MKRRDLMAVWAVFAGAGIAPRAGGQTAAAGTQQGMPQGTPPGPPASPSASPQTATSAAQPFTAAQLDQLLAPIALYPDALLAQTLMAASYPLEVVEAARWSKDNPGLKGAAALAAVKDKGWDVSVTSLVAFPQVLAMMNSKLDWIRKWATR